VRNTWTTTYVVISQAQNFEEGGGGRAPAGLDRSGARHDLTETKPRKPSVSSAVLVIWRFAGRIPIIHAHPLIESLYPVRLRWRSLTFVASSFLDWHLPSTAFLRPSRIHSFPPFYPGVYCPLAPATDFIALQYRRPSFLVPDFDEFSTTTEPWRFYHFAFAAFGLARPSCQLRVLAAFMILPYPMPRLR
jgi:hypothetical protein